MCGCFSIWILWIVWVYVFLTDWYGHVIYSRHFNVEIGAVVLPLICGCYHSSQDSWVCCGLPYILVAVDCLESFWPR